MVKINWEEFKLYKAHQTQKTDNFEILLDFMKSYYSMHSPTALFESLNADGLAIMMFEKRNIVTVEDLEEYLFQARQ